MPDQFNAMQAQTECLEESRRLLSLDESNVTVLKEKYGPSCINQCCPDIIATIEATEETATPVDSDFPVLGKLSFLDKLLPLWIFLAMAIGLILGNFVPNTSEALNRGDFVGVSIPIAVALLVMMYPILCKVRYEHLHVMMSSKKYWIQVGFSLVVNWILAPLVMLALAWAFLPDKPELREGLIFVGLGRCIAMVLIWNGLVGGDSDYCAILVAINSLLQIVLVPPLALLFVNVLNNSNNTIPINYGLVAKSVAVFLGIPVGAAALTRFTLRPRHQKFYDTKLMKWMSPLSLIGLIFAIIVMFASQGEHVVQNIVSVLRVAAPLVVYFFIMFTVTMTATMKAGFGYQLSCTQSFTAASNNFELSIALTAAIYGVNSQQALASTVGPLVEVPVLVGLVYFVRWASRHKILA